MRRWRIDDAAPGGQRAQLLAARATAAQADQVEALEACRIARHQRVGQHVGQNGTLASHHGASPNMNTLLHTGLATDNSIIIDYNVTR